MPCYGGATVAHEPIIWAQCHQLSIQKQRRTIGSNTCPQVCLDWPVNTMGLRKPAAIACCMAEECVAVCVAACMNAQHLLLLVLLCCCR